jgi:lon-related putative ATP-dependent protease
MKLLTQPFAWQSLKRVLQSGEIRIESLAQITSLISTLSLEPEPIPLDIKVVLLGDRNIYYLLEAYDPEFCELFKVMADFDDRLVRDAENEQRFAQLIANVVRQKSLRHLDREAVARTIDHSMRLADDNERLSSHMRSLADLLQEADYWAGENAHDITTRADVQQAIEAQIHRADRIRERLQEEVERGTLLIATEGEQVGQINGLSVLMLGGFRFGHPTRITARARLGKGQVVDIEREVELGGPIHSKGVYILSGFLAGRYAHDYPLSLSASLVFEQSYGAVEGDSASSAELYALLSALAGIPIKQSFAVTGSVNQLGEVQAIGGVNEKIEGFFDICRARGLDGQQGVLIPASNVKHLMLREDVVEAVRQGEFAIYPVATIDQGIEQLTGLPAGERNDKGEFPQNSFNRRVEEALIRFTRRLQELDAEASSDTKTQQAGTDTP